MWDLPTGKGWRCKTKAPDGRMSGKSALIGGHRIKSSLYSHMRCAAPGFHACHDAIRMSAWLHALLRCFMCVCQAPAVSSPSVPAPPPPAAAAAALPPAPALPPPPALLLTPPLAPEGPAPEALPPAAPPFPPPARPAALVGFGFSISLPVDLHTGRDSRCNWWIWSIFSAPRFRAHGNYPLRM